MKAPALSLPVAQAPTVPLVRRRGAWAWPLLLALAFVIAVASWLQWNEAQDLDDERRTLITDALTLDSRLNDWVAAERAVLETLANQLPPDVDDAALLGQPAVVEGLRRHWISVTALDADSRVRAHVPPQPPREQPAPATKGVDEGGLSAHLSTPIPSGGRLILRFAPTALLRQTVPWWLGRKYRSEERRVGKECRL